MEKKFWGDEETGLYQDEDGEFKEKGFWYDKETGIYQDEDGEFKEKGFWYDKETGIYQNEDGEFKEKGFWYDDNKINTRDGESRYKKVVNRGNSTKADSEDIEGFKWLIGFGLIVAVVVVTIMIAIITAPLILLIVYGIKKRENKWWAVSSILTSGLFIINYFSDGALMLYEVFPFQVSGFESKLIATVYFLIFTISSGLLIEKYTSDNIPVDSNGNFFTQKSVQERRPLIIGIEFFLVFLFSTFLFVNFSGKSLSKVPPQSHGNSHHGYSSPETPLPPTNITEDEVEGDAEPTDYYKGKYWQGSFQQLKENDLIDMSLSELKIMRNEIFARHGYIFKTPEMRAYFSQQDWYQKTPKLNNNKKIRSLLDPIEKSNVELIQAVEEKIKSGKPFPTNSIADSDFYILNVYAAKTEKEAQRKVKKLRDKGYRAAYLWIPDYKSLSAAEMYAIYIGPFLTLEECIKETEKYRKKYTKSKAYGLLVSNKNKRVEIRGKNNVKIIEPYK